MRVGDTEVLTLSQAAELLGVSRKTLVAQAAKGVLKATLTGAVYLVTRDEVERYRKENKGKRGNYDHKTAKRKPKGETP
jgi:excisionase family DNA binding protein